MHNHDEEAQGGAPEEEEEESELAKVDGDPDGLMEQLRADSSLGTDKPTTSECTMMVAQAPVVKRFQDFPRRQQLPRWLP